MCRGASALDAPKSTGEPWSCKVSCAARRFPENCGCLAARFVPPKSDGHARMVPGPRPRRVAEQSFGPRTLTPPLSSTGRPWHRAAPPVPKMRRRCPCGPKPMCCNMHLLRLRRRRLTASRNASFRLFHDRRAAADVRDCGSTSRAGLAKPVRSDTCSITQPAEVARRTSARSRQIPAAREGLRMHNGTQATRAHNAHVYTRAHTNSHTHTHTHNPRTLKPTPTPTPATTYNHNRSNSQSHSHSHSRTQSTWHHNTTQQRAPST